MLTFEHPADAVVARFLRAQRQLGPRERALLGVVPATDSPLSRGAVEDRVAQLLDMLGFDPDAVSDQLVLTPACGLAGASPAYAREVLGLLAKVSQPRL